MAKKPTITINQDQLTAAMLEWELQHRAGNTRPHAVTQGMAPEEVAKESAEALWHSLQPKGAAKEQPAETGTGDGATS